MNKLLLWASIILVTTFCYAQNNQIINVDSRKNISLNGTWHYIVDPYDTGFYDYRFKQRPENDGGAYWNNSESQDATQWTEHGYKSPYDIQVPGDWNSQDRMFVYYEGTVWYQREFDKPSISENEEVYLYFGAVNYEANVFLNGKDLGSHKGGFTPFNFKIPKELLKDKGNFLVVRVNNNRHADEVPTLNTDWWNYGGITRDVKLVMVPKQFMQQYTIQLDPVQDIVDSQKKGKYKLKGTVKLNVAGSGKVTVAIPELKVKQQFDIKGDSLHFEFEAKKISLWSPENPKLYEVTFTYGNETVTDKIGFRKIEVKGKDIVLNEKKVFLRGICIHEEIPQQVRRAHSNADALQLLGWAKELNANMVRLAHYPHNEHMVRVADSLGILVWSEIPVYWTIDFKSKEVLAKAKNQLTEMITRDRNRASVIIWSVGNETPVSDARTTFMSNLALTAKKLDPSRLVSAALEVSHKDGVNHVDDPLGQYTDIVSLNEYLGWYGSTPDQCRTARWTVAYNKPFFISETGAEGNFGFHADKTARFSEEYQEWYYNEQIAMFKRSFPDSFSGISPWILADFRSPRRNNPTYQEGWNTKGLISKNGERKKAFYIMQAYYKQIMEKEKEVNSKK
ncbi:beta-glucuronidase [Flavobacterium akiainvivens]|uniref:Beta-glucuronidase n=1 Tax=Flavobacterium akiainvivens TaxID=1202724 RepID=A0A0M8MFC5_9FLAO|nr:glycoside hydrolase family 2 TIM barrel-domain containing protein [Flavobacterium akiainvivens]KOS04607.1 beta-glucuronidase [Flavobacterium akiainvivens]SFQ65868.1 beta-glucuronidase [Flavobacterium akiainvivens]